MDLKEFEASIDDIEKRLDRLRALYENYFRGYEPTEPAVARKDVERKIQVLRREQVRNTALRFRFTMVLQRYTTLSNQWQRISKQVEEGTYRLQLERTKRRREERKERKKELLAPEEKLKPQSYEIDLEEDVDPKDLFGDADIDSVLGAIDAPGPHVEPAPPPAPAPTSKIASFGKPTADGGGLRPKGVTSADARRFFDDADGPSTGLWDPRPEETSPKPAPAAAPAPAAPAARAVGAPAPSATRPLSAFGSMRPAHSPNHPTIPLVPRVQPVAPAVAKPPAPASSGDALNEQRMRRIYDDYVEARRKNNERVDNVKFDNLQKRIADMLPELRKKHGDKKIDFEVVVKDGRVGLKPRAT